jgi:hypothetical protein
MTTADTAIKNARKQADAEFNDSCEKLKQAIETQNQHSIDAAYSEMCKALNRCNELGLF